MLHFIHIYSRLKGVLIFYSAALFHVAPRIDFDDHKLFEETTNKFSMFEDYFYDVSGSPRD